MNDASAIPATGSTSATLSQRAQIAVLTSRLESMEAAVRDKKPSRRERFMAWAGVVALCISISTGAFTMIKALIVEPRVEVLNQFQSAVREISEINQDVVRAAAGKSPAEAAVILGGRNLEKWNLLRKAEALLPRVAGKVTTQEYYVLATEEANTNRFDKAIDFSQRAAALARKGGDKTELSEVLRIQAQLVSMAQGADGLQSARRLYSEAQEVLKDEGAFGASSLRARVVAETAILEAFWGDCGKVPVLLAQYARERDKSDVVPASKAMLQKNLEEQLSMQKNCAIQVPPI